MSIVVELDKHRTHKARVYSGRSKGEALRKQYDLDNFDFSGNNKIEVIVPSDVVSINESFFLGFFGSVVRRIGKDQFIDLCKFVGNEVVLEDITIGIELALKESVALHQGKKQ